jgi:hypothetical protein
LETRSGVEAVARLIDTETSDILSTQDVYCEIKDIETLRSLAEGMALKFRRDFPLVNGFVIDKRDKNVFTDLGQEVMKLQRRVIVYREMSTGKMHSENTLGMDNHIIGRARVSQVMPEMSKAALLDCNLRDVKLLDKVISE